MSQYISEDIDPDESGGDAQAADVAQRVINASQIAEQQAITNTQNAEQLSASSYLDQDTDEYAAHPQQAPSQIEQYLELGDNATEAAQALAENTAFADEAAAETDANTANAAADAAAQAEAAAAMPQQPAVPAPPAEDPVTAGRSLYQAGAFATGGIGGISNAAADATQRAALREGTPDQDNDEAVSPADPVGDVGPVENDGSGQKQSEGPVERFQDHLQHPPGK